MITNADQAPQQRVFSWIFIEDNPARRNGARTFSYQVEVIMFITLEMFFATRVILKLGEYHWDFSRMGNIRSPGGFRPIACEQKYLMDYNSHYSILIAY